MATVSKLFIAPTALAGCLFALIYRETRGAALADEDRRNFFPASPLVSVTKVLCGTVYIDGVEVPMNGNRCFAIGPQTNPTSSWSPDVVTAVTVGFFHDAWLQLGGTREYSTVPSSI